MAAAVMISPFHLPWEQRLLLYSYPRLRSNAREKHSGRNTQIHALLQVLGSISEEAGHEPKL